MRKGQYICPYNKPMQQAYFLALLTRQTVIPLCYAKKQGRPDQAKSHPPLSLAFVH